MRGAGTGADLGSEVEWGTEEADAGVAGVRGGEGQVTTDREKKLAGGWGKVIGVGGVIMKGGGDGKI